MNVNETNDNAVQMFKQYDRVALPVINNDGVIVGVVTVDDVLDVAVSIGVPINNGCFYFQLIELLNSLGVMPFSV